MLIESAGKFTPDNLKKFISALSANELLLEESVRIAQRNLAAFMELVFDLDCEAKKALRTVLRPRLAQAFIDATIDSIEKNAEFDFTVETRPTKPGEEPSITLGIEITQPLTPGSQARAKCRDVCVITIGPSGTP